ncbi:DUF4367 domain-containing protein [Clostridium sp. A1-XYC3]|uniref:DUF4367 domain-containing protein n=1 Tax=Clostridium tanneri TaxID=3037988 RepID=A0ABU4JTD5_9CLOT|nr:DUF4367 domain-containing protein [Clostridium sp. A1-XYC3]MDW8801418.1 DUF4367 domain-containing protein [Clostridium sp. A1-XYC3]
MKNTLKNPETISNDSFIYDELKIKPLELKTEEKNKIVKPLLAASLSTVTIIISLLGYQHFSQISNSNLKNKTTTISDVNSQLISKDAYKINDTSSNLTVNQNFSDSLKKDNNINATKFNTNIPKSSSEEYKKLDYTVSKDTKTSDKSPSSTTENANLISDDIVLSKQDTLEVSISKDRSDTKIEDVTKASPSNDQKKEVNSISSSENKLAKERPDILTLAEAEEYWGSKVLLPSYIPEGFELTDISISRDNKEKYVRLTFSSNNAYFKITQNQNTKYTISGKATSIDGLKVWVTETTENSNSNTTITRVLWNKGNVQYSLAGNIPKDNLINICKSVN